MIDTALIRQRFEAIAPFLDERGRRLVAASEAAAAGYGGIAAVAAATGVAPSTIGRGIDELSLGQDWLSGRVRRADGASNGSETSGSSGSVCAVGVGAGAAGAAGTTGFCCASAV